MQFSLKHLVFLTAFVAVLKSGQMFLRKHLDDSSDVVLKLQTGSSLNVENTISLDDFCKKIQSENDLKTISEYDGSPVEIKPIQIMEGIRLGSVLRLALEQYQLTFRVRHGTVVIMSQEHADESYFLMDRTYGNPSSPFSEYVID